MNGHVAGLDGCRGGWIAAILNLDTGELALGPVQEPAELFEHHPDLKAVAIDMPIGLPERSGPRGRTPERIVRPKLGALQSSVFSIPSRRAVYAGVDEDIPMVERFRHCCAIARDTSEEGKAVAKQGFAILPKIVAIDRWLRAHPELVERVFECHPEVSFWAMNARTALSEPKKVKHRLHEPGLALRRRLLAQQGFDCALVSAELARQLRAGLDDLIDACAACWTAARIVRGEALPFPNPPDRDAYGLPIAIWA